MAIAKHQELSQSVRGSDPFKQSGPSARSVETVDKVRLTSAEYRKLEKLVLAKAPGLRETDPGALGIRAGMYEVLAMVREGFVNA